MLVYEICLVVGLVFALFSAVAGHFFGGHDGDVGTGGHAEGGLDNSGISGISIFSPTMLATLITAFGAFGMIFQNIPATSSQWVSAPLAAVSGLAIALAVFWLVSLMFKKTESSSESRVASLVGQAASIVTPIPENGVGEIAYVQGGTRYTAPARANGGKPVLAGQSVKITRIVGTQFFVDAVD